MSEKLSLLCISRLPVKIRFPSTGGFEWKDFGKIKVEKKEIIQGKSGPRIGEERKVFNISWQ